MSGMRLMSGFHVGVAILVIPGGKAHGVLNRRMHVYHSQGSRTAGYRTKLKQIHIAAVALILSSMLAMMCPTGRFGF
jgi:hypothetical protein